MNLLILNEDGKKIDSYHEYSTDVRINFAGRYGERVATLESFPKYTRGKVRHEIMYKYVGGEYYLVLREDLWRRQSGFMCWMSNGLELDSYYNWMIPDGKGFYIKEMTDFWTVTAIVEYFERKICSDVRYIYSLKDLQNIEPKRIFLEELFQAKNFWIKKTYSGYGTVSLHISLDGKDYLYYEYNLSYGQKKLFSEFKDDLKIDVSGSYSELVEYNEKARKEAMKCVGVSCE